MRFLDLLAAIAASGIAVSVLFLAHRRGGDDRGGPRAELVRFAGVAALAAAVCGVMNVLEVVGGGTAAAAVGNATNVIAPAMMWAAARRLNGRNAIGTATAGAGAIVLLGVTFLIPLDDATLLKTAGIVVYSVLATVEFRRGPVSALAGARLMACALLMFALYNAGRLVVAAATGMDSPVWHGAASPEITSIVSAVVIALVGVGALRLGRVLDDDPAPGTRAYARGALRRDAARLLTEHGTLVAVAARLPEVDLIRAAHSSECAETLLMTLRDATRAAVETGAVGIPTRDTVVALVPVVDAANIDDTIREAFGARMAGTDYDDTPDVSFSHHRVRDLDALAPLLHERRLGMSTRELPTFRG